MIRGRACRQLGHLPECLEAAVSTGSKTIPIVSELGAAERNNSSGGQAIKGIRWMPWHQEAKKDVVKLR